MGTSPAEALALPLIAGLKSCYGLDHARYAPAYDRRAAMDISTETISALLGKISVHTAAAGPGAAGGAAAQWASPQLGLPVALSEASLGLVSISELHEALQCINDYASQDQPQNSSRMDYDHGPGPGPHMAKMCPL